MNIRFYYNEDRFRIREATRHKAWLLSVINKGNFKAGLIEFIFIGSEEMTSINKKFLNHSYATDVIAFDYSENGVISGEIFICPSVIKDNAETYSVTFSDEIRRVLVHAVLHLMGYSDSDHREQEIMRNKEDEALNIYRNEFQI